MLTDRREVNTDNCDICGLRTNSKKHIEKDYFSDWYQETFKINVYYCETCEVWIKRSKIMAGFINEQTKALTDIIHKYEKIFDLKDKDIEFKMKHIIDTRFMDIERRFKEVLQHLENRLKEKGI